MSPFFVYAMALMLYFMVACLVWIVSILLVIPRRTRSLAKKLAAGMVGSFPGVILFQIISAPLVLFFILLLTGIFWMFHPDGEWEDIWVVSLLLCTFGVVAVASLLGFYTGWQVAWEIAAGRSGRDYLRGSKLLGPVVQFCGRKLPFLK